MPAGDLPRGVAQLPPTTSDTAGNRRAMKEGTMESEHTLLLTIRDIMCKFNAEKLSFLMVG